MLLHVYFGNAASVAGNKIGMWILSYEEWGHNFLKKRNSLKKKFIDTQIMGYYIVRRSGWVTPDECEMF